MAGNDFVMVRLTKVGETLAAGGLLRANSERRAFTFKPGESQRVERSYEWLAVLSRHVTPEGEQLFELAPAEEPEVEETK